MPDRVDWHTYFMNIARQVATRATCPRKHVGAVIARDRTILSTGYNGSARGLPHCEDVGCDIEDGHCVSAVHAEANAIIQAARIGVSVAGAELYTTASPCWPCFKLIANAGISRVYYGEFYRDEKSLAVARQAGIELVIPCPESKPGRSSPSPDNSRTPGRSTSALPASAGTLPGSPGSRP